MSEDLTQTVQILGVSFFNGSVHEALEQAMRGGLVVVPSGPGLAVDLRQNADYRTALTTADLAITDSGAMVLFWRLLRRGKLQRVSGLLFLKEFLHSHALRQGMRILWVHPNRQQQLVNEAWLTSQGLSPEAIHGYIAPNYPTTNLEDHALLHEINHLRPAVVVLCIGGGVQERLGLWLRSRLAATGRPCPAIFCTGAAIGFLSGNQVNIPPWADRLFLGWLLRCFYEPRKFVPRYLSTLPLAYLIARYRERLPDGRI